jgi:hypothetical protein
MPEKKQNRPLRQQNLLPILPVPKPPLPTLKPTNPFIKIRNRLAMQRNRRFAFRELYACVGVVREVVQEGLDFRGKVCGWSGGSLGRGGRCRKYSWRRSRRSG